MFQISENDGLPYQICGSCTNLLSTAFSFKQMCQQSDAKLRQYISKINSSSKCFVPDVSGIKVLLFIIVDIYFKFTQIVHLITGKVKEEKSHISGSNGIIDFKTALEHNVSQIKEEQPDSQISFNDVDNKPDLRYRFICSNILYFQLGFLFLNKSMLFFRLSTCENSADINNKCIQTKFIDFFQTLYNCSDCGKKFSSLVG